MASNQNVSKTIPAPKPELANGISVGVRRDVFAHQASANQEFLDLNSSVSNMLNVQDHFKSIAAFTGTDDQTGPFVDISRKLLRAKTVAHHGRARALNLSTVAVIPTMHGLTFLDSQINGIIHMYTRAEGTSLLKSNLLAELSSSELDSIETLRTFGGIIADTAGLGKTIMTCGYLSLAASLGTKETDSDLEDAKKGTKGKKKANYRPVIILVPSGVVLKQWLETLSKFRNLKVCYALEHGRLLGEVSGTWVDLKALEEDPRNASLWPEDLKPMFDCSLPEAAAYVFLSTYSTFTRHSLSPVKITDSEGEEKIEMRNIYNGVFGIGIFDEGHELRHDNTSRYLACSTLGTSVHWFLTGTPVVNAGTDIIAPLRMLWTNIAKSLMSDLEVKDWMETNDDGHIETLKKIENFHTTDIKRLMALNPDRLKKLIETEEPALIQKWFPIADKLICLRRSAASKLQNYDGTTISLRTIMPHHTITTIHLEHSPIEAREHAFYRRAKDLEYVNAVAAFASGVKQQSSKDEEDRLLFSITTALRGMCLLSTSTLLERFDYAMRRKGSDSSTKNINKLRSNGFGVHQFIEMVHRSHDLPVDTADERVKFLCYGSPKARIIYEYLWKYGFPSHNDAPTDQTSPQQASKLLITEELRVSGLFIELLCEAVHVECVVIHSGLSEADRVAAIARFQDPNSSLRVIVLLYGISIQGLNLDRSCWEVLVMTCARNWASEIQAVCRPLMVSQTREVRITRLFVRNTHDEYREAKQADKAIFDMAMKKLSIGSKQFIASLLNTANIKVKAIHELPGAKELLNGQDFIPFEGSIKWLFPKEDADETSHISMFPLVERPDDESNEIDDADMPDYALHTETYTTGLIKVLRKHYTKLSNEIRDEPTQDILNFYRFLFYDPNKVYTVQDLEDNSILHRGLRLLYGNRIGQETERLKVTPSISYAAITKTIREGIDKKHPQEQQSVEDAAKFLLYPRSKAPEDILGKGKAKAREHARQQ